MQISHQENEQRLRAIAATLQEAQQKMSIKESVLFGITDENTLNGFHGSSLFYSPQEYKAFLELPEKPRGLIMPLHAINSLLYVLKPILEEQKGQNIVFPTLELFVHGELHNSGKKPDFVAATDLRVNVPEGHYVVSSTKFKGEVLTVSRVTELYYRLLTTQLFQEGVLDSVPVNVLFVHLRDAGVQPEGDQIALEIVGNRGAVTNRHKFVSPGKIDSMRIGTV